MIATDWSKERYVLEFELLGLPAMMNSGAGRSRHWKSTSREKRRWRRQTCLVVRTRRPPQPLAKARVTCTRFSSVEPDYDGLVSGFKPIIDGLVDAEVLANDKKEIFIGEHPEYRWEKSLPGQGKVTVRVEEIQG